MTKEENEEDLSELIYDLFECFMMTWEELMGMTSAVGYDIWREDVIETTNYPHPQMGGDTLNPNQTTQHPQMGGDISNPKQVIKHLHTRGGTSNTHIIRGGRHFKPTFGDRQLNRSLEQHHPTNIH